MSYPEIARQVSSHDEWTQAIKEDIVPVAEAGQTLLAVRDQLLPPSQDESTTLAEAEAREERVRPFLVGGITEDGEYSDDALTEFTDRFLGVRLDSPKRWVTSQRDGVAADEYVTVEGSETGVVSLLQMVDEELTAVIRAAGVSQPSVERDGESLLETPQEVVDTMQEFLTGVLRLTANAHPFVFFAVTTRSLSKRYLEEAYPQLQDDFQELTDFLGLQPVLTPSVEEVEKQDAFTVWGHEEGGVLDCLYHVNQTVWEAFGDEELRDDLSYFFDQVPDPRSEFKQQAEEQLAAIDWSYPGYIEERMRAAMDHEDRHVSGSSTVHVDNPPEDIPAPRNGAQSSGDSRYGVHLKSLITDRGVLDGWTARTVNTGGYSDVEIPFDEPVSLFRYLDDIMPAVFVDEYRFETSENGVRVYHAR